MVELLTSNPLCDLNIRNETGDTPVAAAKREGHTTLADYLASKHREVKGELLKSCTVIT